MKYIAALVFSGLCAISLAGEAAECVSCRPAKVMVVESAPSCAAEKESCSGRRTFAQRRADRVASRQARRSCSGEEAKQVVILCEKAE